MMAIFYKNLIIAGSFLFIIFLVSIPYLFLMPIIPEDSEEDVAEEVKEAEIKMPTADVSNWKTYRSSWFGFEVKYPENWNAPIVKRATRNDKWEYRYLFRKKELGGDDAYAGFDVAVYSIRKIKRVLDSEEFPPGKNQEVVSGSPCDTIDGNLSHDSNYPAEEINISSDNSCFYPALFYAFAYGQYGYNIIPVSKDLEKTHSTKEELLVGFPEFFSVASNFNLVDIKRKKVVPVITAPKPSAPTKRGPGGKRVCAKKGDDPSRSDNTKKKHLDMECCLDPNEIPNPHCYYSKSKYGKYL